MPEYAVVISRLVESYEHGPLAFTPGEQVRVIARAICGPEARTLVECEAGLVFHVEHEGDLMHDWYPEPEPQDEDEDEDWHAVERALTAREDREPPARWEP